MAKQATKGHKIVRGLSRPCVRCGYKYGCCKKCDLCKLCHAKEHGDMNPNDVLRKTPEDIQEENEQKYYWELNKRAKQGAINNPGGLGCFDPVEY